MKFKTVFASIILTLKAPITTAVDDKFCNIFLNFRKIWYEGDPRSNANPSVISFTFGIIKNGLPVYYDI